jgi:hypothetical protein
LIREEADLRGAGLRLATLPDLSRLVRPRGLRSDCARSQARRQDCRRTRAGDAEARSAGRLRDLWSRTSGAARMGGALATDEPEQHSERVDARALYLSSAAINDACDRAPVARPTQASGRTYRGRLLSREGVAQTREGVAQTRPGGL